MYGAVPKSDTEHERPSEYWEASLLDKITYRCANRMLADGMKAPLEMPDLTTQPARDYTAPLLNTLQREYEVAKPLWFLPRLFIALVHSHFRQFIIVFIGTFLEGVVKVAKPLLLSIFLTKLSDTSSAANQECYLYAFYILCVSAGYIIVHHILFYYTMRLGWNWRTETQALIFDHLLKVGNTCLSVYPKGHLINMISNDVGKFEGYVVYMNFSWCVLLEVIVFLVILIYTLDVAAALVGFSIPIMFIPIQVYLGKLFARLRGQTAGHTDQRIRHVSESLEGIATVKSYGWEAPFFALIKALRFKEESTIRQSQKLKSYNAAFDYTVVPLSIFAMFTVYYYRGGQLTLPKLYSSLLIMQSIRGSMCGLWMPAIEMGAETIASCLRVEAFLNLKPRDTRNYFLENQQNEWNGGTDAPGGTEEERLMLAMKDLHFSYSSSYTASGDGSIAKAEGQSEEAGAGDVLLVPVASDGAPEREKEARATVLSDLDFSVVGPVGAGKSSLLLALLGELNQTESSGGSDAGDGKNIARTYWCNQYASRSPRVAYAGQIPWIVPASVKQNIMLAATGIYPDTTEEQVSEAKVPYRYREALRCCQLSADLETMPAGDDTEIGERGITISGGQKARVSLARAVTSDCDLYLLDDPLSAVDAHVSKAIFEECILDNLIRGRGKTVILVTHQLQYLPRADKILVLSDVGKQTFFGTYSELVVGDKHATLLAFAKAAEETENGRTDGMSEKQRERTRTLSLNTGLATPTVSSEDLAAAVDAVGTEAAAKTAATAPEFAARDQGKGEADENTTKGNGDGMNAVILSEDRAKGRIALDIYYQWLVAGGLTFGACVFLLMGLAQGLVMIHEYWLTWWALDKFSELGGSQYILVLGCLTAVVLITGFVKAFSFYTFTITAASRLHERLSWSVLRAPLAFFTANPSGRVLNRFSKDQNHMDEQLAFVFYVASECSVRCVAAVILVAITIPWLLILIPPLVYSFGKYRTKYLTSVREIKRLEGNTRSPVYAGFSSSLEGLSTIKAFGLEDDMRCRFYKCCDENGYCWWSYLMVARWFGFRLDSLAMCVLVATVFLAVYLRSSLDIGLLGFTLVYTINLTGLFQWTVRQCAEVESLMTSVERILQYTEIESEAGYKMTLEDIRDPSKVAALTAKKTEIDGSLDIAGLEVRYRQDLPAVLQSLSMRIPAGAKVAIVGRTGSGKSTIMSALLRLNLSTKGDISTGVVSANGSSRPTSFLKEMSLEESRALVTIIPQQPNLFLGSLRFNIDPFQTHTDAEVLDALRAAHLEDLGQHFEAQEGPRSVGSGSILDMQITEGGSNLSVGQRQLLSLARAVLRKSKIILMDEVTANIDYETDQLIQETIRSSPAFRDVTIISVAHRLLTIADCDLVFVIEKGTLVEEGPPLALLTAEDGGYFKKLAVKSGNYEMLLEMARKHKLA